MAVLHNHIGVTEPWVERSKVKGQRSYTLVVLKSIPFESLGTRFFPSNMASSTTPGPTHKWRGREEGKEGGGREERREGGREREEGKEGQRGREGEGDGGRGERGKEGSKKGRRGRAG